MDNNKHLWFFSCLATVGVLVFLISASPTIAATCLQPDGTTCTDTCANIDGGNCNGTCWSCSGVGPLPGNCGGYFSYDEAYDACGTPEPTNTPVPTQTPMPTNTPFITPIPEPTNTPIPTPTTEPAPPPSCYRGINCCTCVAEGNACVPEISNWCSTGYQPQCTNSLAACDGTTESCNCVPIPSSLCGALDQPCCPAPDYCQSNLICSLANICVVPAAANPDRFCDSEGNPTHVNTGILNTAIGCITVSDPGGMVAFYLRWGMGIIGGLAFVMVIYSSYLIIVSQGDRNRITQGKRLLGAAIIGLLLFLFSAYLLYYLGYNVLGIPINI